MNFAISAMKDAVTARINCIKMMIMIEIIGKINQYNFSFVAAVEFVFEPTSVVTRRLEGNSSIISLVERADRIITLNFEIYPRIQ